MDKEQENISALFAGTTELDDDDKAHRERYLASLGNLAHQHPIRTDLWDKMEDLSIAGAVLYSFGIDPDTIRLELECGHENNSLDDLPKDFQERLRIIKSAVRAGSITRTPNSTNSNDCDEQTRILMSSFLGWYKNIKGTWPQAEAVPAHPQYQAEGSTPKPMKLKPPVAENIGTKERETLLKIIIGMAIGGYGYDPLGRRSEVTGEKDGSIHFDLESQGISVDADTIRKYLNEAKQLLPQEKQAP